MSLSVLLTFHFRNFDIFIYQKNEINSTEGSSISEVFGLVFDESKTMPTEISDSNIWFSLDHPKVHDVGTWCEFIFCRNFNEFITSSNIQEELLALVHIIFVKNYEYFDIIALFPRLVYLIIFSSL